MASQERFGYEWKKFPNIIPEYESQFLDWVGPLKPKDFKNKIILDAGCGTGRNSFWPLIYGAKKVMAFDYDQRTVAIAKKNLAPFKNVSVRFGNIYEIPERDKFDISHSIGVISHLEYPELALEQLVKATKKGGIVLIWVLSLEGNKWVMRLFNPVRIVTSRLPVSLVNRLAYFPTIPVYLISKYFPGKNPYLQKISKFSFSHIRSIVFDHMLPKEAHYYKRDEVVNLLRNSGLKSVQIFRVNNNSWTVIGRKS